MRFSAILAAFAIGTAIAVPVEKRDNPTPVSTITQVLTTLQNTVQADAQALATAAGQIQGAVGASVTIVAALKANLNEITAALQAAGAAFTQATEGAIGGIAGAAAGFTQAELDLLVSDLNTATALIKGIQATLTVTITNVGPDVAKLLASETAALKAALDPFAKPLLVFAQAVEKASATVKLTITGLKAAANGLGNILGGLLGSLGL